MTWNNQERPEMTKTDKQPKNDKQSKTVKQPKTEEQPKIYEQPRLARRLRELGIFPVIRGSFPTTRNKIFATHLFFNHTSGPYIPTLSKLRVWIIQNFKYWYSKRVTSHPYITKQIEYYDYGITEKVLLTVSVTSWSLLRSKVFW